MSQLELGFRPADGGAEQVFARAVVLRGFARKYEAALIEGVDRVVAQAPFRQMFTPGGRRMSVGLASCGTLGWVTDAQGYRYSRQDPHTGRPWPPIPVGWLELAAAAAAAADFSDFEPDACLVNRYGIGARMSLHQDRNERDFGAPIVSVSLGLSAVFMMGGLCRSDPTVRVRLNHCDVMVWGAEDRLRFHGVRPIESGHHDRLGACRINLTFRKAG